MTAILSLFLSFAMLFTGGALPATADTASTLAVQDVVVGYNGESYPLGFDIALSAAAAQDELSLHFELVDGEDVFLPLSGKITRDGVTFAISEEGSAYTLTAETLNQLLGLEEGDVSSIETVIQGLESYVSAFSALEKQPVKLSSEQEAQLMEVVYANMDDMLREDMNWDFGNGEIPAEHVNGMLSGADFFAILDGWMAMDDETIAPALSAVLDLYNSVLASNAALYSSLIVYEDKTDAYPEETPAVIYTPEAKEYVPAETFTQLLETVAAGDAEASAELEAMEAEMDIITAAEGDVNYSIVNLYMPLDENMESVMNVSAETTSSPEETHSYFALYLEQGSSSVGYEVNAVINGPVENPESVNLEMMIQNDNELDFTDYEAEEVEEDILYTSTNVYVSSGASYEDGLEDTDLYMEITESNVRYANGELNEEGEDETISLSCFVDEEKDENGNLTGIYDLTVSAGDEESYSLNFTTLLTQAPAEDYFANLPAVNLPADGEDPAYQTLSADAAALLEDAVTVAADDEFAALMEAFAAAELSEENDDEDADAEYIAETDEEEYDEEYAEEEFASLEDVNAAYPGVFVNYTAPEGFEVDTITVSNGDYLYANYYSEDGRYISVNQSFYEDTGLDYFAVNNGETSLIEGQTAAVYKTDAGYYYAQFYLDNGSLSVYFDDCDAAAVQEILAGLSF